MFYNSLFPQRYNGSTEVDHKRSIISLVRPRPVFLFIPLIVLCPVLYFIFGSLTWNHALHHKFPPDQKPGPVVENSPLPTPQTPSSSVLSPSSHALDEGPDYWNWTTHSRFHNTTARDSDDLCAGFPTHLLSTIQVVLKVGGAESPDRLNSNIETVSRCITNLLVFSDMDFSLGPFKAHDIIADLPASYRARNPEDFETYDKQRQLQSENETLTSSKAAWNLDRFKFLPMIERAREQNPTAKWFVFLESDTYIFWDNVFRLLDHYSPSVPLYFGSPAPGRLIETHKVWFAYGGTGYILSAAAISKLLSRQTGQFGEFTTPSLVERYQELVSKDPCGDSVLGVTLWEAGIEISGLWPMMNPHAVHGVPFGELYWCQPVLSLHKSFPEDVWGLWKWEQGRRKNSPLLYADLFEYFNFSSLSDRQDWDNADWDGFSPPDPSPAHSSSPACAAACQNEPKCYQWTYHMKHCTFVRSIRLGARKGAEGKSDNAEERRFFAGWDGEKIKKWRENNECKEVRWMKPSVERHF